MDITSSYSGGLISSIRRYLTSVYDNCPAIFSFGPLIANPGTSWPGVSSGKKLSAPSGLTVDIQSLPLPPYYYPSFYCQCAAITKDEVN